MDASIGRHMDGWIHDRKKLWGCPLSVLVNISDSSIHHCSCPLAHSLWAQPISPGFQAYLNAYEMVQRLHSESEGGAWSQPRIQLSQEITDICTFLEANHSTPWWRLQDTFQPHTPHRPISRFFQRRLCQLFWLIVTHWAQYQAHSRYAMKVCWTEVKFPTVLCCI